MGRGTAMQIELTADYLELAQDCLDKAKQANQQDREKLLRISEVWISLAADELVQISG